MANLTQEDVENFILLAGQTGERWFKLSFVDEGMNSEPTAVALMESIADVIHDGITSMAFAERQDQAIEDTKIFTGYDNESN